MTRSTLVAAAALAAALIAPATTLAGGWATVGLSSLPDGARPGEEWVVDLTVLQHGRTPLEGVQPRVLIEAASGGTEEAFTAGPRSAPVSTGRRWCSRRRASGPTRWTTTSRRSTGWGACASEPAALRRRLPRRPPRPAAGPPDSSGGITLAGRSGSPLEPDCWRRSSPRCCGVAASRSRRRDERRARRGRGGGRARVRRRGARRRDPRRGRAPSAAPPSTSPAAPSSRAWAAAAATRSPRPAPPADRPEPGRAPRAAHARLSDREDHVSAVRATATSARCRRTSAPAWTRASSTRWCASCWPRARRRRAVSSTRLPDGSAASDALVQPLRVGARLRQPVGGAVALGRVREHELVAIEPERALAAAAARPGSARC